MQSCKKMSECSKSVLYLHMPLGESSVSVKGNLDRKKSQKTWMLQKIETLLEEVLKQVFAGTPL